MITYNTGAMEVKIIKITRLSSDIRNWIVKLVGINEGYRVDKKAINFIQYTHLLQEKNNGKEIK